MGQDAQKNRGINEKIVSEYGAHMYVWNMKC